MNWRDRYSRGGVCDFRENYEFYFRWLLNKVCSCFVIKGLEGAAASIDPIYLKANLIQSGLICITDFNDKLYACIGNWGGQPNEYYEPTQFIIANPVLGSKTVNLNQNGVLISNTAIDKEFYYGGLDSGLGQLINQTATLLADNIISINCNQINSRITAFFTADSEAQAVAGETILKKMYAGKPFSILRSDLVEKIQVNPISTAGTSQNITELVQLNNYILSNFFHAIGIKANNNMKKERMIVAEVESQDDPLKLSLIEMLTSWQEGFDKVNQLYGTNISVELNPILIDSIKQQMETVESNESNDEPAQVEESQESQKEEETEESEEKEQVETEPETEPEPQKEESESEIEEIKKEIEVVNEIVEMAQEEPELKEEEVKPSE